MPIYTYECATCSSQLEKRQSFSEDPLTIHDNCGGSLRRIIHPAGIVFKGSGFYNTDYKNSTSGAKSESDAAAAAASDSSKSEAPKSDSAASDSSAASSASSNGSASSNSSSESSSSKSDSKSPSSSNSSSSAPATP